MGESLSIPTAATNGTLIPGNLAQCGAVIANDTSFTTPSSDIVAGQYALAAVDGSNSTLWQPLTNATARLTVDLLSPRALGGLHIDWGGIPATSFAIAVSNSTGQFTTAAQQNVTLSVPYVASAPEPAVAVRAGNTTTLTLPRPLTARYVQLAITGSFLADGKGATVAEFAVIAA